MEKEYNIKNTKAKIEGLKDIFKNKMSFMEKKTDLVHHYTSMKRYIIFVKTLNQFQSF